MSVLISSGGIESVTLQYMEAEAITDVIHFHYGQSMLQETVPLLREHCDYLSHRLLVLPLGALPDSYSGQPSHREGHIPLVEFNLDRGSSEDGPTIRRFQMGYMEGRGALFLLQAAIWASCNGHNTVLIGLQMEGEAWERHDSSAGEVYGSDTSQAFLDAAQRMIDIGFASPIRLDAPFLRSRASKREIVKLAVGMGIPVDRTYSCEFYPRCGKCLQCLAASDALSHSGVYPKWLTPATQ